MVCFSWIVQVMAFWVVLSSFNPKSIQILLSGQFLCGYLLRWPNWAVLNIGPWIHNLIEFLIENKRPGTTFHLMQIFLFKTVDGLIALI